MKIELLVSICLLMISSCVQKNNSEDITKFSAQLVHDTFPYAGKYSWKFDLMTSEQVSTHILHADSITYTMSGKVYNTDYTMKKLSFDNSNNKWIGIDENGIAYALFFKDKTDTTLTIYKHKCKSNGIEEALQFAKPAADATSDHGWNVYSLNGHDLKDVLPVTGRFNNDKNILEISDGIVVINGKIVEKISFHAGERRWVGKYGSEYVQLFFQNMNEMEHPEISITWSSNSQELYNTKYQTIHNWQIYERQ